MVEPVASVGGPHAAGYRFNEFHIGIPLATGHEANVMALWLWLTTVRNTYKCPHSAHGRPRQPPLDSQPGHGRVQVVHHETQVSDSSERHGEYP